MATKTTMFEEFLTSTSLPMSPVMRVAVFVAKQLLIPLLREHGSPLLSKAWRSIRRLCGPHLTPWRTALPTTAVSTTTTAGLLNCRPISSLPSADMASDSVILLPAEVTSLEEVPLASVDPDYCAITIDMGAEGPSI